MLSLLIELYTMLYTKIRSLSDVSAAKPPQVKLGMGV